MTLAIVRGTDLTSVGPTVLDPTNNVIARRLGANPTFNFSCMAENIVKVGSTYWCVYTRQAAGVLDIRLASASALDGTWTDYGSNPILTLGSQDWENSAHGATGCSIVEDGGTFHLFYGSDPTDLGAGESADIGLATASAITGPYTKHAANPVLARGTTGVWDSLRVAEPSVIKVGATWVMAYMGEDTDVALGQSEKIGIATASAPEGPWTKAAGNPLIGFGSTYDVGGAADPSLFYEGGRYWIWYSGLAASGGFPWVSALAYAATPTGTWTRHRSNPVLGTGITSFETVAAWRGAMYAESGKYWAVYGALPAGGDTANAKSGVAILDMLT